jgi:hypothetical protein
VLSNTGGSRRQQSHSAKLRLRTAISCRASVTNARSSNLAMLAIPISFLIWVVVRRVHRALAVEALLDSQRLTYVEAAGRALSRALGDRCLALATWSAERGQYLGGTARRPQKVPIADMPSRCQSSRRIAAGEGCR